MSDVLDTLFEKQPQTDISDRDLMVGILQAMEDFAPQVASQFNDVEAKVMEQDEVIRALAAEVQYLTHYVTLLVKKDPEIMASIKAAIKTETPSNEKV